MTHSPSLGAFGYSLVVPSGHTAASSRLQLHPFDPCSLLHKAPVATAATADGGVGRPEMMVNQQADVYAVRLRVSDISS